MTKKSAVISAVRDVRRAIAPAAGPSSEPAKPSATVKVLPGRFRHQDYIARHVAFVVGLDAERGEAHVQRNLDAIRWRLDELGVDKSDAERELRVIEAAVRREIWRQILLP